jgi:hypothetical protein
LIEGRANRQCPQLAEQGINRGRLVTIGQCS